MSKETPYPCKIDGKTYALTRSPEQLTELIKERPELIGQVGIIALALFWEDPDIDYIAVGAPDEEGEVYWTRMFENYELLDWMAGFTLPDNRERTRNLALLERKNKTFRDAYGWTPDVVIEWVASDQEKEGYAQAIIGDDLDDDEHLHAALNESLKEDF